jgi:hypothetical protein
MDSQGNAHITFRDIIVKFVSYLHHKYEHIEVDVPSIGTLQYFLPPVLSRTYAALLEQPVTSFLLRCGTAHAISRLEYMVLFLEF